MPSIRYYLTDSSTRAFRGRTIANQLYFYHFHMRINHSNEDWKRSSAISTRSRSTRTPNWTRSSIHLSRDQLPLRRLLRPPNTHRPAGQRVSATRSIRPASIRWPTCHHSRRSTRTQSRAACKSYAWLPLKWVRCERIRSVRQARWPVRTSDSNSRCRSARWRVHRVLSA